MNTIKIHRPDITPHGVSFSWSGDTRGLYLRNGFRIELKGADRIPERLWLTLQMMCMHTHWALLQPCRIELPHHLPPEERERWIRLVRLAFETLDGYRPGTAGAFALELADGDADLPGPVAGEGGGTAASFSGGRDSLTQAGLLLECGEHPLLVATTSPMPPLMDHENAHRRRVFDAVGARGDVGFTEVVSDFRSCWDNGYAAKCGFPVSVNAMTDTLLYLADTAAAGWLRGCSRICLAAESEVSDAVMHRGRPVLFHHFMYSIPVLYGLSRMLEPWGLSCESLTSPLRGPHVQALLTRRYPELAKLQYSCWKVDREQAACSSCSKCLITGYGILVNGGDPRDIGIDLERLVRFAARYRPSITARPGSGALPRERVTWEHQMNMLRMISRVDPDMLRRLGVRTGLPDRLRYRRQRRRIAATALPPAPGWRPAYMAFIRPPLREKIRAIYDKMFDAEPEANYAVDFDINRKLIGELGTGTADGNT